jgi:hypothetical protein
MSHGTSDARPDAVSTGTDVYKNATAQLALRGRARIKELFEGLELVEPGLVWLPEWHPDQADTIDFAGRPESSLIVCGVARKN